MRRNINGNQIQLRQTRKLSNGPEYTSQWRCWCIDARAESVIQPVPVNPWQCYCTRSVKRSASTCEKSNLPLQPFAYSLESYEQDRCPLMPECLTVTEVWLIRDEDCNFHLGVSMRGSIKQLFALQRYTLFKTIKAPASDKYVAFSSLDICAACVPLVNNVERKCA